MTGLVPTYVYKCDKEHTFEVMQPMAEDSLDTCEVCGAPARRILFAPAVHFKGSGFYTTDYARKGAGKSSNGSDGDGSSESKKDKSSDSSSGSESKGSDSKASESKGSDSSSSKSDSKATKAKD